MVTPDKELQWRLYVREPGKSCRFRLRELHEDGVGGPIFVVE